MSKIGILMAVLVLVTSCAQRSDDDSDQPEESVKHVWSGQVQAMDKAKGVEKTLMQSAQQQGREIEQQSQ